MDINSFNVAVPQQFKDIKGQWATPTLSWERQRLPQILIGSNCVHLMPTCGLSSHHKHLAKPYVSVHQYTPVAPGAHCKLDMCASVGHPARHGKTSTSVLTQSVNIYPHQSQDIRKFSLQNKPSFMLIG